MKKIDCVTDITMESITLDDLCEAFSEMDERVRRAHSVEEVVPILRETYFRLRTRVLEDYITKEMENKPDKISVTTLTTVEPNSESIKTNGAPAELSSVDESDSFSPDVPSSFSGCSVDAKAVQPGEILYLDLDGKWRPYRVLDKSGSTVCLLGLFSIGDINEKSPRYSGSLSSQFCDDWCGDILKRNPILEDSLELSKIGTMAFYVHIPDWEELQKACNNITGDLTSAWYNDDDLSNIQVYTGKTGMTSVLCGEDGELHEFHYEDVEGGEGCFPAEVHPAFTLRLGKLPYYYHPTDRACLAEFS